MEVLNFSVLSQVRDLDGLTANFTILDISLCAFYRDVNYHGNLFQAVRAFKEFFDFFHFEDFEWDQWNCPRSSKYHCRSTDRSMRI